LPGRFLFAGVLGLSTLGAGASTAELTQVVVSAKGFRPETVEARKGEPLHLGLSTADHEHCFAIDELRVEKRVVPGRTTAVDITPDKVGRFAYYCCLENGAAHSTERGTLVVTE
jgi:heme/copper-type cytochrome/quinol oxidase subunit 2